MYLEKIKRAVNNKFFSKFTKSLFIPAKDITVSKRNKNHIRLYYILILKTDLARTLSYARIPKNNPVPQR